MQNSISILTIVWLLGAVPAIAQQPEAPQSDTPKQLERQDHDFLTKAQPSNRFELRSSRLALQRAGDPRIKEFAQQMITDHGSKSFAVLNKRRGKLPPDLAMKMRDLESLSGTDFDHKYMEYQLAAHKEAIGLFEQEAKMGQNAQLRRFAQETLPSLRHHLEMVQQLQ